VDEHFADAIGRERAPFFDMSPKVAVGHFLHVLAVLLAQLVDEPLRRFAVRRDFARAPPRPVEEAAEDVHELLAALGDDLALVLVVLQPHVLLAGLVVLGIGLE
jgi:hypothetical protein